MLTIPFHYTPPCCRSPSITHHHADAPLPLHTTMLTIHTVLIHTSADNIFAKNNWIGDTFVCPQSLINDRFLFNEDTQQWTVDRFLDDFTVRYGVVLQP
jgi:hypothetical protein